MSFKPFSFTYNPPSIINTPAGTSTVLSAIPSNTSSNNAYSSSNAGQLIAQASALLETNQYLQTAILARSQGLGITLDTNINPEIGQAFSTLYPGLPVPSLITINMYNRILDAEFGAMQIKSGLGTGNALEVNSFESGSVSQISSFTETALISSGNSNATLPLLLRTLKGDTVVLNNLTSQLSTYPVISSPAPTSLSLSNTNQISLSGLDISSDLNNSLSTSLNSLQTSYASAYQLTAGTGTVDQNITPVISACISIPTPDLIRMSASLTATSGNVHIPSLSQLMKDLTSLVFIQLIAEAVGYRILADKYIQSVIMPLKGNTSSVGVIVSLLQALESVFKVKTNGLSGSYSQTSGPLKGMSFAYQSGLPTSQQGPTPPVSVSSTNQGLLALAAHISLAIQTSNDSVTSLDLSFSKLLNRKIMVMNQIMDVQASLQDLNTIIKLITSVISYNKSGNSNSVGITNSINPIQGVGQILSSMTSSSGVNYIASDTSIQAVPASIPTPSISVQNNLKAGGANIITPSTYGVSSNGN